MKFGNVDSIENIDFILPADDIINARILSSTKKDLIPQIYIGCPSWNRQNLKNFYPRGTKDELTFYATQFNAIELNAAFYRIFPPHQYETWALKVGPDFKFFPKIYQGISHWKRLKEVEGLLDKNLNSILRLEDHLEMPFIQLPANFAPNEKNLKALHNFIVNMWPKNFPLAIEFRHEKWFGDSETKKNLLELMEKYSITLILTDTAGRRDLMHMGLTTPHAFIRYVGTNDSIMDYTRLDYWIERMSVWYKAGIEKIYFFIHQNNEEELIEMSQYLIQKLNARIGTKLKIPLIS